MMKSYWLLLILFAFLQSEAEADWRMGRRDLNGMKVTGYFHRLIRGSGSESRLAHETARAEEAIAETRRALKKAMHAGIKLDYEE